MTNQNIPVDRALVFVEADYLGRNGPHNPLVVFTGIAQQHLALISG